MDIQKNEATTQEYLYTAVQKLLLRCPSGNRINNNARTRAQYIPREDSPAGFTSEASCQYINVVDSSDCGKHLVKGNGKKEPPKFHTQRTGHEVKPER